MSTFNRLRVEALEAREVPAGDLAYAAAGHPDDAELRSRLDEELRDLD